MGGLQRGITNIAARLGAVAGLLLLVAGGPVGLPNAWGQTPAAPIQTVPAIDLAELSAEERSQLLSRLSDQQVRELLLRHLQENAPAATAEGTVVDQVHEGVMHFRAGLGERLSHVGALPSVPGFIYDKLAAQRSAYHPLLILVFFVGFSLAAHLAERLYRRSAQRLYDSLHARPTTTTLQHIGRSLAWLALDLVGVAIFAAIVLGLFFLFYHGHEPTRLAVMTLLTALLIVRVTSAFLRFFFAPAKNRPRIAPFDDTAALRLYRWIMAATAITAFGLLTCALMLKLGLPEVQHALAQDLLGIVAVTTLIVGAIRLRQPVATALLALFAPGDGKPRFLSALVSFWHLGFIAYILLLYALETYQSVTGGLGSSYPGLLSLMVVLLLPAADYFLRALLDHCLPATTVDGAARPSPALPVLKRAARILLVILAAFVIGRVWGVDFFALGQESFGEQIMRVAIDIALTLLAAYVAWGAIRAALARYMPAEADGHAGGDEGGASSASRLETIMPLLMRFLQITLAVIAVMIILSSLGVDIGPLLAGAGVVGLAVGFGAQSLVRDVVSGLFYLMDDAFRKGEYVDIGSVKGTVESINIRSLVLRHHLGPVHTVPYGEIQHLTNFSRDWVIMKLEFRVPTDTDINRVKKIFKQIGAEMLEHPELGQDFLEPFKSQGVKSIEDSAIIVRGKFMSKPGRQFVLRKELYSRVQAAFQANRIPFAHRKVTVELPPGAKLSPEQEKQLTDAAGAAAIAAEEAEKEATAQPARR